MNIRFIEAFLWVAKLQSFRAAAEKLNVSQATISSRISSVETEFECRLFDRDKREITLTNQGSLLLDKAERLLMAESSLIDCLKNHTDIVRNVRIGVIESVVHTWFGAFISQLKLTYPNIEFELTTETTVHLKSLFNKGALDIIIQTDPILDSSVINTEVEPLDFRWVCCEGSAFAHKEVQLTDIANTEIMTFTRGSLPHLNVVSMFQEARLKPLKVHCISSIAIISQLVQQGFGVATLPTAAIVKDLEQGKLILLKGVKPPAPLRLIISWQNLSDGAMNTNIVEVAKSISKAFSQENTLD